VQIDRRIEKTKTAIKKAYMDLLKNHTTNEISVVDVANRIDINRSTFYFHYGSIQDVQEEIENDIINSILEIVKTNKTTMGGMVMAVASYVETNHKTLKTMFLRFDGHFTSKIEKSISEIVINSPYKKINGNEIEKNYVASFIMNGALGVFIHWIMDDCSYPKEKLIKAFYQNISFPIN
jgi:ACT domain-containing protein